MADKDTTAHPTVPDSKEDLKEDEPQDPHLANQDPTQGETVDQISEVSTDTEKNAVPEEAITQPECELAPPTDRPCLKPEGPLPEDNSVSMDKDSIDGPKAETQQEEPLTNMQCGDMPGGPFGSVNGPPVIRIKEFGDMSSMSTMEEDSEGPAEDKDEETLQSASEKPKAQTSMPKEISTEEQTFTEIIETISPTLQEDAAPTFEVPSSVKEDKRRYFIAIAIVALVAILFQLIQSESPPLKKDVCQIDIFHQEMEKLKVQFPSQREDLWKRSRIHLAKHFLMAHPTEPISVILTAGVRAEGTLRCLAQSMASALSSALNASVLHIEGASKSGQESDEVKSDIDSQLQKAFKGDKPIAVIHHFEDLPPASTLIFYRYCDHENAAFKKIFLIFTILLGDEDEIPATIHLSAVEEMVNDHLQNRFLSHGHPTAFDTMDIDKYSGLWSRISHLILPVATEERLKKTGHC